MTLALSVLDNCDCQVACTKCLIDRSTQWHIEDLDRHSAIKWLRLQMNNQIPDDLKSESNKISMVFGSLNDEINRLNYHYGIKEINIHVNNQISEWEFENLKWINILKRDRVTINLVIEGDVIYNNNQERLSAHLLSHNFNLKEGTSHKILNYPVHLTISLGNGMEITYISQSNYENLSDEWSTNTTEKFFKIEDACIENYEIFNVPELSTSNHYESRIKTIPGDTKSCDIAKMMIDNLKNAEDLVSKIRTQAFTVSYYDKYNQSEFSLRLILQFINQIKKLWPIQVSALNVHLSKSDFKGYRAPQYIIHNYLEINDYEKKINELSFSYDFDIMTQENSKLPHYRYFEFKSDKISFEIRIDGGIAHGLGPVQFLTSEDMTKENQVFAIKKYVDHDIIYNISF